MANVHRQFRRVRPGQHLHNSEKIEERRAGQPGAFRNDFHLHQCDMCGRSAKRGTAEAQEERRDATSVAAVSVADRGR